MFKDLLQLQRESALLKLSDAADFGIKATGNARKNIEKPFCSIDSLEGVFSGIPAIIVGAGPSLEEMQEKLLHWKNKGIVFAGGKALELIATPPHFGVCIDPHHPIQTHSFPKIPFFFQVRMHPENHNAFQGQRFCIPESHFSFLNAILEAPSFDAGWTVGNTMASLAVFLGCNPIVAVGMDFCYQDGYKYAGRQEPIASIDTQKDWLMAVEWMRSFSDLHTKNTFYNTSKQGLAFWEYADWDGSEILDLEERICGALQNCCFQTKSFSLWEDRLAKAQKGEVDAWMQREWLDPLWNTWQIVFAEAGGDMQLHKSLFCARVIQEYADAFL